MILGPFATQIETFDFLYNECVDYTFIIGADDQAHTFLLSSIDIIIG